LPRHTRPAGRSSRSPRASFLLSEPGALSLPASAGAARPTACRTHGHLPGRPCSGLCLGEDEALTMAEDAPITVSVIVPVHSSASHLERCLTALARSTTPCWECVVVDDGSTDASRAVAQRPGVTLLALTANRGPAHARNRAAEVATGDVLLFID